MHVMNLSLKIYKILQSIEKHNIAKRNKQIAEKILNLSNTNENFQEYPRSIKIFLYEYIS